MISEIANIKQAANKLELKNFWHFCPADANSNI